MNNLTNDQKTLIGNLEAELAHYRLSGKGQSFVILAMQKLAQNLDTFTVVKKDLENWVTKIIERKQTQQILKMNGNTKAAVSVDYFKNIDNFDGFPTDQEIKNQSNGYGSEEAFEMMNPL